MRNQRVKVFFGASIVLVFIFVMISYGRTRTEEYSTKARHTTETRAPPIRKFGGPEISCYFEPSTGHGVQEFCISDCEKEPEMPQPGRSIFFLETSCFGEEGVSFTPRKACSVESAALMNPKMMVYLLLLSPSKLSSPTKAIFDTLTSYDNVRIRRIVLSDYVRNTPLEDRFASGVFGSSKWPVVHMSDILRFLTLWKFPGIYLDLDFVVTTCLDGLGDFAGIQVPGSVNNAVLGFGTSDIGRQIAEACVNDLKANFHGDNWAENGPGVITRALYKACAVQKVEDMTLSRCHGFTVYPQSVLYPLLWDVWKDIFSMNNKNETMKKIKEAKGIHLWNQLTNAEIVKVGSGVPYDILAKQHCPKIHQMSSGKTM